MSKLVQEVAAKRRRASAADYFEEGGDRKTGVVSKSKNQDNDGGKLSVKRQRVDRQSKSVAVGSGEAKNTAVADFKTKEAKKLVGKAPGKVSAFVDKECATKKVNKATETKMREVAAKSSSSSATTRPRNSRARPGTERGVDAAAAAASKIIYLGHIPEGFYEVQMKRYFSQYGKVKQVKLFRSPKTNRPKGYAFIEFFEQGVAEVAAESMNGYIMFQKTLVCHVVPTDKCHEGMFKPPKKGAENKNAPESDQVTEEEEEEEKDLEERMGKKCTEGKEIAGKQKM